MPSPKWDLHFEFGPVEGCLISKRVGDPENDQWLDTPAWLVVLCMYMTKNDEMYKIVHRSAHKFPKEQWPEYAPPVLILPYHPYPTPLFVLEIAQPFINDPCWAEILAEPKYEEVVRYNERKGTRSTVRQLNVRRAAISRWDKRGRPLRFNETLTSHWYVKKGLELW